MHRHGLLHTGTQGKGGDFIVMESDLPTGFGGCPGKAFSGVIRAGGRNIGECVHLLELWLEADILFG